MRGKWFIASASVVLLALAAIAVTMLPRPPANKAKADEPATEAPPASGDISLPGKIRAKQVIHVVPPFEGTIGAFFVEPGQEVFEGQLLARITNEGLAAGQEIAEKAVELTQSRINTLESSIVSARLEASRVRADASRARGEYERLEKIHRRQQMLFNEGATPKVAYEKSSREFELAESEFRNLEQLASQAESYVAGLVKNLDSEKLTLDEKTDELEQAKARSGAAEVVSPAQGIVVARTGEVGQSISPDRDFIQIATQISELEVALEPDPPTMRRIKPGQAAQVSLPEQGAGGMPGSVKSIQGSQAIVEFTSPNPAVKPGMVAQVRIKVD